MAQWSPFGMDCAQVGVIEETHEISLGRFLKGENNVALETKIGLEILSRACC